MSGSGKQCGHHKCKRWKHLRRCCAGFLIFCFIILVIFLLTWAILQPQKPQFMLQDATVYAFNLSPPNFLNTTISLTVSCRNPNDNIGIYYDNLLAYATYQNQQITFYTELPSGYQGHKEVIVWSPYVSGINVPVAPYNSIALNQDSADGTITLVVKIDGRVRWRVGSIITGDYRLHVRCPAMINFGSRGVGVVVGNAVKYQLVQSCSVSV